MVTKSAFVLNSRSASDASTLISAFSLKRLAVDLITANASGNTSIRTASICSSIFLVSLSTSVAMRSFSSGERVRSSNCSLRPFFFASSAAMRSAITFFILWASARKSSSDILSIFSYAARVLFKIGLISFKSLSALEPNIFFNKSENPISVFCLL